MTEREKEIKIELEDIISRLEESRNNAMETRESNEMGLQGGDFDFDYVEDAENVESALFEFNSLIDEMIQIMGEEIENLRNIVEKIDIARKDS